MSESVAEGDARRSGLDEFCGISGMEHSRLSGHVGEAFYTEGEVGARGKRKKERKGFNAEKEGRRHRGRRARRRSKELGTARNEGNNEVSGLRNT